MSRSTSLPDDTSTATLSLDIVLALGTLYFVWGSTYLAIRFAVESYPPYLMLLLRFMIAGGLLYGFLRLRSTPQPTPKQWLGSAITGTFLLVGGMGGVTLAQSLGVSSSLTAIVVCTMPLWFAFFMRLWGERSTRWELLGMVLGLVGVVFLNFEGDLRANPFATLVLFSAPLSWAFGSALSRSLPQAPGMMASAAQMLGAGVVFSLVVLFRGERLESWPSPSSSLALVYLITFGSILAFSAYVYLLNRRTRPALLSSYAYVNPVVAVLLGVGLAGETITLTGFMGMAVILAGVVLAVTARARSAGKTKG